MMSRPIRPLLAALVLTAGGACAHQPRAGTTGEAMVTGTVTYRERVALPPDAVVELSIIDASVSDAAAPALATATVNAEGRQVPLPFSIIYDPAKVHKLHLYTIRAKIRGGGELLFATDVVRAVITQDNPTTVDLLLSRVDPTSTAATGDLAGTSWELADLNGDGVVGGTHVTLDFADKGRATGNGSCNRYFSTVELSGSSITFGAVGATRMACATAVSLQEVKYFEALEAAHRYAIEDNTLSIFGGGARPLRFTRATR